MKKIILFIVLAFCYQSIEAQRWCNQPDESFCPGNFFTNGDFEALTGDPNFRVDEDINRAVGWRPLWGGNSDLADLHCTGAAISTGQTPNPNSNVYAGMWIENRPTTTTTSPGFREGMYNQLATPIPQNSGSYTFNFNIANSNLVGNGGRSVDIGIYGVYNTGGVVANVPGGANSNPTNLNLWASVSSAVQVVYLGTITTPTGFTNTWIPQSITFNSASSAGFPTNGITHIMVTADDNARPTRYSKLYVNFDEFCLQRSSPTGNYCCEGENLVPDGSFEGGTNPTSQYSAQATIAANSVLPGQFAIIPYTSATTISSQWDARDPSNCSGFTNDKIMVVNGKTTQPSGSSSIVYENNVPGLDYDAKYKFCIKMKNLPQCAFDVKPKVTIRFNNGQFIPATIINTNVSDVCDWQELSITIGNVTNLNFKIYMDETGVGDGNDLAIDDISLQLMEKPAMNFTISQPTVNASDYELQASATTALPDESCRYYWIIGEMANPAILSITNPMAGNNLFRNWGLTTNFKDYNGGTSAGIFEYKKFYLVGLYIYDCDCNDRAFTYQVIYHNGPSRSLQKPFKVMLDSELKFTKKQEEKLLKKALKKLPNNDKEIKKEDRNAIRNQPQRIRLNRN